MEDSTLFWTRSRKVCRCFACHWHSSNPASARASDGLAPALCLASDHLPTPLLERWIAL
jgi:hypothetical protein